MAYDREQKRVIRAIRAGARRHGATRKEELAAYMTGSVESGFRNLNHGDSDSKGWRQERQQFYKNPTNLRASIDRFFTETKSERGNYRTPGELAQAVQRSAFPERYAERRGEALKLYRKGRGTRARANSTSSRSVQRRIPGVDNSAERQSVMLQYLETRGQPGALLGLASGLEGAQDLPGQTITDTIPGRQRQQGPNVKAANGVTIDSLLSKAVKWDKAKVPYLWGGGHGKTAKPGQPVDCSGYVSAVLGLKTPMVSGQLAKWGKPGKGKWVTVYAHDSHTLMSIRDPKSGKVRWFGTSKSNPGGGAGEISKPSASYLSSFAARHPG